MKLKLRIQDVPAQGIVLQDCIAVTDLGLTENDYVKFVSGLDVIVKVEKFDNTIQCAVEVAGKLSSYCCRSLVDVKQDWTKKITLSIPFQDESEYIDLAEEIRQEIFLDLPIRILADGQEDNEEQEEQEVSQEDIIENNEGMRTHQPFANLKIK